MKIYIGGDHAGFELKEELKKFLTEEGHEVEDFGAFKLDPKDDYPDFVIPVAKAVSLNTRSLGIVLGGSGQGEAIVANKIMGIRSAVYYGGNLDIVRLSKEHNSANILSLGARFITLDEAKEAVNAFIETPFSREERHIRRLDKVEQISR
jgi:ribose 5-phosphate isomerase B